MAISDLTGTTWVWNDAISASQFSIVGNDWHIDFTSNSTNYALLTQVQDEDDDDICKLIYGSTLAYNATNNTWANNAYKTIIITGGTDVTDATLIAWLEANATQQSSQITVDLSILSGWSNVTTGSHTLTIKAKASGYRDSEASTGVSFTKTMIGYTLTFTLTNEGDYADIYYKTPSDQTGTLWTQCGYGNTITIQDCTAFQVSNPTAGVNNVTGTLVPPCQSGDYIEYVWLSLGSDVSINLTVWQ